MKIGKKRSKLEYVLSLILIMGPWFFLQNLQQRIEYRFRKMMPVSWQNLDALPLRRYAEIKGIDVIEVESLDSPIIHAWIEKRRPDIIIHQSQNIVRPAILNAARIGVLNRHNALLPKNRGRLTPFWVLYRGEKETGVSIHWVNESIDDGDIVYQERILVDAKETFESLVRKNYAVAPKVMLEALRRIERGDFVMRRNDRGDATYNSVPTLADAWCYRKRRLGVVRK
jgi:methionyl-tRNA formyltransferase